MSIPANNKFFRFRKMILMLILISAALLSIPPASAETGVTILAAGGQSYFYGEAVVLHGENSVSDTTYLFITGPNLPAGGAKLTSPKENATSGDPATFTTVKTGPDKKWEYTYYTANLRMDAGTFTIYAASQPTTAGLTANDSSGRVSIILKRPFIFGEITPATVLKGQPVTIAGTAEGDPTGVRIWILGKNTALTAIEPVRPDTSFSYEVSKEVTANLATGQYYVFLQHPMQNGKFDIDIENTTSPNLWVCSRQLSGGDNTTCTRIFKLAGAGSLQGEDAAAALAAAFGEPGAEDTYTMGSFAVEEGSVSAPSKQPATTSPVPSPTHASPLWFAPLGALALITGMLVWSRR